MENINYETRIRRLQTLIELELEISKKIVEHSEWQKLEGDYQKLKTATNYSRDIYTKYLVLRGNIKNQLPFECHDTNVFQAISGPKEIDDKSFNDILDKYKKTLLSSTDDYLKSDALKIKIESKRENMQDLNRLFNKRMEFVISFLEGIENLKTNLPEDVKAEIQKLKTAVDEIDNIKAAYNDFVENFKKNKESQIQAEHNIMLKYSGIFNKFLEDTLSSLENIIKSYNGENPKALLSKKHLSMGKVTRKPTFNSRGGLKKLFEKTIPGLAINLNKKDSKKAKQEKSSFAEQKSQKQKSTPNYRKWPARFSKQSISEDKNEIQEKNPDQQQSAKLGS